MLKFGVEYMSLLRAVECLSRLEASIMTQKFPKKVIKGPKYDKNFRPKYVYCNNTPGIITTNVELQTVLSCHYLDV